MIARDNVLSGRAVSVSIDLTLCEYDREFRAVTSVGRVEEESGVDGRRVALFNQAVGPQLSVEEVQIAHIPDGGEPAVVSLFVPLVARLFATLQTVGADLGWTGYVAGSDVYSELLRSIGPQIGARRVVTFDSDDPFIPAIQQTGRHLYLVTDSSGPDLIRLLEAVPDESVIALLGPVTRSTPSLNVYETIHKKSLALVGGSLDWRAMTTRAYEFCTGRLPQLGSEIPIQEVSGVEDVRTVESSPLILSWT